MRTRVAFVIRSPKGLCRVLKVSAEEAKDPIEGAGYAVASLEGLGEGYGFRKIRSGVGVSEFGVNAIVLPAGIDTGPHMHERQQELYFVHSGQIEIEFGDGSVHTPGAGRDRAGRRPDRAHDPKPWPRRRRLRRRRRRGRLRRPRRTAPRGRRRQPAPDRRLTDAAGLTAHTAYLTFETTERREFVRITDEVQAAVDESGVAEGMALVAAMHITAGVWINDDEPGIQADTLEWLDKLAPPSWQEPANDGRSPALTRPRRLPPSPRRRGQRRRPPEEPARPPPGDRPGDRGQARPRPLAGDLLLRVRRPAAQAAGDQGARRVAPPPGVATPPTRTVDSW